MSVHPLSPATDHRLGRPLPHQLANQPQVPPIAPRKALVCCISTATVCGISSDFSELFPTTGQIPTCYSPVCHYAITSTVRLACIRHAASVYPEPGSNSPHLSFCDFLVLRPVGTVLSSHVCIFGIIRLRGVPGFTNLKGKIDSSKPTKYLGLLANNCLQFSITLRLLRCCSCAVRRLI